MRETGEGYAMSLERRNTANKKDALTFLTQERSFEAVSRVRGRRLLP